ncbi:MAG: hypothetical protein F6K41_26250 [Symploca sp. SIO3E6]|nr:hypothetical protein [Caldora sp. SIO3E6]
MLRIPTTATIANNILLRHNTLAIQLPTPNSQFPIPNAQATNNKQLFSKTKINSD